MSTTVFVNKEEGWINTFEYDREKYSPGKDGNGNIPKNVHIEPYTVERYASWLNKMRESPSTIYIFECKRVD